MLLILFLNRGDCPKSNLSSCLQAFLNLRHTINFTLTYAFVILLWVEGKEAQLNGVYEGEKGKTLYERGKNQIKEFNSG